MKIGWLVGMLAFIGVAGFLAYNYAQTGTLSGAGSVGSINISSGYTSLIDNLTAGLAVGQGGGDSGNG